MTKPANLLFIMSDEHTRQALGCYGSSFMKTPNLDRLAGRGTRFASAYNNSPLCVPSRASLATGRYAHQTGCWDNGHPWDDSIPGWSHRLRQAGHRTVAIGKLHYRSTEDDNGFDEEIIPMHVRYGIGDLFGLLRDDPPSYGMIPASLARDAGPGESNHTDYDREITRTACDWLRDDAPKWRDKPWVLFVSFVCPHFPLIAPQEFFDLYSADEVPWPRLYSPEERSDHPAIIALNKSWNYDDYFDAEKVRIARAAYYGLCSFLDHNVGQVLAALDDGGLTADTRIIYTSDHGECLGNRGIWSTSVMYEESVGVPLIVAGADLPEGAVVETPVSLVDCYPTIVEGVGETLSEADCALPGRSLIDLASHDEPDRVVFSEYHAGGSITGFFMVRNGHWKYVHYEGLAAQLFDLEADPGEEKDLANDADYADVRAACEAKLRTIADPEAVNARAFADQRATIMRHGGVDVVRERGHPGEHTVPPIYLIRGASRTPTGPPALVMAPSSL